jgi:hypothetical protein
LTLRGTEPAEPRVRKRRGSGLPPGPFPGAPDNRKAGIMQEQLLKNQERLRRLAHELEEYFADVGFDLVAGRGVLSFATPRGDLAPLHELERAKLAVDAGHALWEASVRHGRGN